MEIEREVWRKRSDRNLWKRRAHLRTITGIVVDEHERVDTDVQLACDIGKIERPFLIELQYCEEGFLGDFHVTDLFHTFLTLLLLFQKFALT